MDGQVRRNGFLRDGKTDKGEGVSDSLKVNRPLIYVKGLSQTRMNMYVGKNILL